MLPTPAHYRIWPSVIPADKCVTMTIAANERAFFLEDGEQYEITIISKDADELDYEGIVSLDCAEIRHDGKQSRACDSSRD